MTFDQLLQADLPRPVVALFYGAACAPCERLKPVLREVCRGIGVQLEEFNSAGEMEAVRKLGIRSVPAVFVVYRGEAKLAFLGYQHASPIVTALVRQGVEVVI